MGLLVSGDPQTHICYEVVPVTDFSQAVPFIGMGLEADEQDKTDNGAQSAVEQKVREEYLSQAQQQYDGRQIADHIHHGVGNTAAVFAIADEQQEQLCQREEVDGAVQRSALILPGLIKVEQDTCEQIESHHQKRDDDNGRQDDLCPVHTVLVIDMFQGQGEQEPREQGACGKGQKEITAVKQNSQPERDASGGRYGEHRDDVKNDGTDGRQKTV